MPVHDHRYYINKAMSADRALPRLQLGVIHSRARHYDVTPRRARTDRGDYHHYRHPHGGYVREEILSTRDSTYGIDRDFLREYYLRNLPGKYDEEARVQLYTHDSSDPYSCTCYPRASNKTIPSMMYDQVRCPHPQHKYQPAEQDVFAYPWTSQSFRPKTWNQPDRAKPTSALTAPPFFFFPNNTKDHNPRHQKPPPYSAPENPTFTPLLSAKTRNRRIGKANRRQQLAALPPLKEELFPLDSASQVALGRPPSLRLRTVDSRTRRMLDSELRAKPVVVRRTLSTPMAQSVLNSDGFPETPTRIFKGEYLDANGRMYQYDIKYGKNTLAGKRNRLHTI